MEGMERKTFEGIIAARENEELCQIKRGMLNLKNRGKMESTKRGPIGKAADASFVTSCTKKSPRRRPFTREVLNTQYQAKKRKKRGED